MPPAWFSLPAVLYSFVLSHLLDGSWVLGHVSCLHCLHCLLGHCTFSFTACWVLPATCLLCTCLDGSAPAVFFLHRFWVTPVFFRVCVHFLCLPGITGWVLCTCTLHLHLPLPLEVLEYDFLPACVLEFLLEFLRFLGLGFLHSVLGVCVLGGSGSAFLGLRLLRFRFTVSVTPLGAVLCHTTLTWISAFRFHSLRSLSHFLWVVRVSYHHCYSFCLLVFFHRLVTVSQVSFWVVFTFHVLTRSWVGLSALLPA